MSSTIKEIAANAKETAQTERKLRADWRLVIAGEVRHFNACTHEVQVEEGEQNGEHNHEVVSWTEYNWQATITTHNMRTVQTKDTLQVSWSIGRML